jgi:hypothetical protein
MKDMLRRHRLNANQARRLLTFLAGERGIGECAGDPTIRALTARGLIEIVGWKTRASGYGANYADFTEEGRAAALTIGRAVVGDEKAADSIGYHKGAARRIKTLLEAQNAEGDQA